ncbi:restriction endonuclease subunit S [Streptococcus sp. 27098_8_148]|uniref:restriction endonuclease subunit S n=1 Tax=Streptococcus TaxID=1301 RepID=UPI00352ED483
MNKPKIRFNEFENIWTKSKLGELYEVYSGNTPSRSDDRNYQNGEIPWIKTTDLNNSIICSNEENISVYGATKLKVLPEKSVLIAMYGGFNQIGRTGLLAYPATINQALAALMPVNEINPNFLLNFLNFKKESWRNVAASSRKDPNITKNDVEKFKISFPSLDEQSAIGSLFRTLDDLLASYKDNLANYQSLKTTMLTKMFPKAGQTVPEIRLDGFEGEWEKSKLKDVAHRVQGNDGRMDLPTLTISASGGWMNQIDRFSANIAGKEQKNYTLLKKGELSYNHGNSKLAKYGVVFELQEYEEALVPKVYHSFRVNQLADAKFIEIMFSTKIPDRELGKLVSSGARMDGLLNISFDDFMNIAIIIPTVAEQQAIGSYFSNIDNLIASHQEKISQLEALKKKLLQDMFI